MRIRFFLILLAVTTSVHAADSEPAGKPMTWRYQLLQTAQDLFEKRAATQAPGATLTFSLPKVDAAQANNQVEIVSADKHIVLPMVSNTRFALLPDADAAEGDAMVVVNRNFRKGEMNHPNVQVRSPGLPDGVRRMGDLRLACAAQMEMAKAEGLKFRAMLATASMFGVSVCDKLEVTKIDAPTGPYDTVTIEDSDRLLVQSTAQPNLLKLGDKIWSDDARISYTMSDHIVP
ncbi:hypothetical protein [Undibacterium sp. Ji49W]|uniref:hypothetical protein n=1 Tax=Undibacterium sp. Ji49W TaxID=3413040 RepID=UPI003BF28DE8